MTNIKVNEILANYNDTDREYIIHMMRMMALIGVGNAPQTDEEFKKFCEGTLEDREEAKAKEEAKRAKKEAREKANAETMGMTIEEYRAYKKLQTKIRRYENEVMKAEADIKKLEEEIAWKKEYIKKLKGEG